MTPWWAPVVWLAAGALVFGFIGWLIYKEVRRKKK